MNLDDAYGADHEVRGDLLRAARVRSPIGDGLD
jgi:hypothetical protein